MGAIKEGAKTGSFYIKDVPRDLQNKFHAYCAMRGMPMKRVVINFMRECTKENSKKLAVKYKKERTERRRKARQAYHDKYHDPDSPFYKGTSEREEQRRRSFAVNMAKARAVLKAKREKMKKEGKK